MFTQNIHVSLYIEICSYSSPCFVAINNLLNSKKLHFSIEVPIKYAVTLSTLPVMEFQRRKQKVCLPRQIIFIVTKNVETMFAFSYRCNH